MFLELPGLEGKDPTMLRMSTAVYQATWNNIPSRIESSCLLDVFAVLLFVGTVDVCALVVSLS